MTGKRKNIRSKTFRRIVLLTVFLFIISAVSEIAPFTYLDFAINAADKEIDISETRMKKLQEKLEQNRRSQQENKKKIEEAENNLADEIIKKKLLDESVTLTRIEIETMNDILIENANNIREKEADIKDLEADIEDQYEAFKQRLVYAYEEGSVNYLEIILGAKSITEFLMNVERAADMFDFEQKVMRELNETAVYLKLAKERLEEKRELDIQLKNSLTVKKGDLETLAAKSASYISDLQNSKKISESTIAKNVKEEANLNKEIEDILAERARQEELKKKKLVYTGGAFLWPTDPKFNEVSSRYGPRAFDGALHRGIDIPIKFGTPIYAVAPGEVIMATFHTSYGNFVMIDHGGGIATLYAHNSELVVEDGDFVEAGQLIAKGGSTGYSTGNHCHFEVRVKGVAVDPIGEGYIKLSN